MRSLAIYIVLLCTFSVAAQDLRAEFETMNSHLIALENYRMTVDYRAGDDKEEFDKGIVSVFVGAEGMFYSMKGASIAMNKENVILIDEEERSIIYSDNQKVKKKESMFLTDYVLKGIDSLISQSDSITFFEEGKHRVYNVRQPHGYFNLVQIKFAGKTLSEVVYHYNSDFIEEEGMTSVCKVDIEENIEFDSKYLSTEFYITERNGAMVPSTYFDNYLIIYNESLENFMD